MDNNSVYHWQAQIYGSKLDGKSIKISTDQVLFDSGTSLNFMPYEEF